MVKEMDPPRPPSENLLNKAHDSADFNANPCFARLVVVVLWALQRIPASADSLQPAAVYSKFFVQHVEIFFSFKPDVLPSPAPALCCRCNSAATTPGTGLPTVPPTGGCRKGTKTLWRRPWPPSDLSQWPSTPSGPSSPSTTEVGGRNWFWGKTKNPWAETMFPLRFLQVCTTTRVAPRGWTMPC